MAGEMTRKYLNDEAFHREYLREDDERKTSPFAVGLAVAGAAGGGLLAYKKGMIKPIMESVIRKAGQYRNGEMHAVSRGLRNWTKQEFKGGASMEHKMETLRMEIAESRKAMAKERATRGASPFNTAEPGEMMNVLTQRDNVMKGLDKSWARMDGEKKQKALLKYQTEEKWRQSVERRLNDDIRKKNKVTAEEQMELARRTGFRYATIGDVMPHLSEDEQAIMGLAENRFGKDFRKKVYDRNVLVHAKNKGEFADTRDFRNMISGTMDSLSDDFTIPFVKINPIRMMYMNKFSSMHKPPEFAILGGNTRQPAITGNVDSLGADHLFANGRVFDLADPDELVKDNVRLVDGKAGPIARYYRNITGLSTAQYTKPTDTWGKVKYNAGQFLNLGFQDEPIGRDISWNFEIGGNALETPNLLDPTTYPSYFAKKAHGVLKPYEYAKRIKLEDAYGQDADWIAFNNYKSYEQAGNFKDYSKQFYAGRDNREDITTATMFPYGLFERLNATLNQVGLGLSNDKLGSAFDVFKNLVAYRVLPVVGAVAAWDYINYESDNLLGFQLEDKMANFYAGASVDAASMRDALGITDWAKNFAYLMPGGDQIADLPFVGKFVDLNETAEEVQQYWDSGEDAVRKGRYWELGNTPFTGGKIEYFEANWARKTVADVEYSDSLWGSREEYFENAWFPTLRHPFAPIKHFLTDPNHYAEKHYEDRPYMTTGGGYTELDEFPLIGPLLNSTIGQILNPEQQMHQDYWASWNEDRTAEDSEGLYVRNIDLELQGPVYDDVGDDVAVDPIQIIADQAMGYPIASKTQEVLGGGMMAGGGGMMAGGGFAGSELSADIEAGYSLGPVEESVYAGYTTPSGQTQITEVASRRMVEQLNWDIKEKSIMKANRETEMNRTPDGMSMEYAPTMLNAPNAMNNVLGNLYYNTTEMAGYYGFLSQTVTGEQQNAPKIADASEMTSMSRQFWDMNIGNLGGDANEIFRRFVPRDTNLGNNYNPIPNTMPSWMPGSDYFTDYQHGDPYTKIKNGEARLPGEGYERLYEMDQEAIEDAMKLEIGPSSIGRSVEEIRDHMLRRDEIEEDEDKFVTDAGTDWHADWEHRMMNEGIGLDFEQYVKVPEMGIGGFYDVKADHAKFLEHAFENAESFTYYDQDGRGSDKYGGFYDGGTDVMGMRNKNPEAFKQFIQESLDGAPMALIDPKTMGATKYEKDEMFFYNVQQVNFYLFATGQKRGYLMHVNRDELMESGTNKEETFQIHAFDYNPELLEYSYSKVQEARKHIGDGMKDGTYGRGDFYDMIDQYRILADTAPYSQEFREMDRSIRDWNGLTPEHEEELAEISDQISARKENIRIYPYRFKTADIKREKATITKVLDNNMFMTEEFENPIKLAGVYVPTGKDDPIAKEAARKININPGDVVQLGIDADEQNQVNKDTYRSISAVLYNRGINVNRQLIDSGLAKEKTTDFSPSAVHARFTQPEIAFGSMWETVAHLDTPYHTKFMQARSALESYKRREVYGKDWQEWTSPVEDFFVPWYQNILSKEPVVALGMGTIIGSLFGNNKYGKILGALIGLTATSAGVAYTSMFEEVKGERWVPQRREHEWDLQEYLDTIKFVKYRRLYEWSADEALKKEGFDVRAYLDEKSEDGDWNKSERRTLEKLKRQLKTGSGSEYQDAYNQAMDMEKLAPFIDDDKYLDKEGDLDMAKVINARLTELENDRELEEITPIAAQSIMYYQESEKTMYGYDTGEPLQNFLSALPKKDRDYLQPFMDAPEEERDEILDVVPDYMKRVLANAWGMPVEEKPSLEEYFSKHGLPDKSWIGWDDRASLSDVKVKMVRKEKLDDSEFDVWESDATKADHSSVQAPNLYQQNNPLQVKERLADVLKGLGLEDVQVQVTKANGNSTVNMDVAVDRRAEIVRQMNEEAGNLF